MKVVLFCGGLGMRLREYSDKVPKPMIPIGYRPILWHVMKYYAAWGHKDFILCLGYRADAIKNYFVEYQEHLSNDFVLEQGSEMSLLSSDLHDWRITFVDTGHNANIGQRLMAVREHLDGCGTFLANYADNLTDYPLPELIDAVEKRDAMAGFLAVPPPHSYHIAEIDEDDQVAGIRDVRSADVWINGGYFVLKEQIFDYIQDGEELVLEPFARLTEEKRLLAMRYRGFWQNMDTFKDRTLLEEMHARGDAPWRSVGDQS